MGDNGQKWDSKISCISHIIWLIKQIDSIISGLTTMVCITICHTVSLTFAGCPLQLYLLRMFCSSAHRKISFRAWFFQMFFNKSLIICEKFVSCLTQYSKKYWKWPETCTLILHSYWTPQFKIFLFLLYGYHHTL